MSFSFVHITDHHLRAAEGDLIRGLSPAYALRAVARHMAGTVAGSADFVVSTGDLVDDQSEAAYATATRLLGLTGQPAAAPGPLLANVEGLHDMPFYCLPGNHDDRDHFFRSLFGEAQARPLLNARFEHEGVQFVCLDWGPQTKALLHQQTLDYLAQSLQAGQPTILLMHYPVVPVGARWLDQYLADGLERFWQTVAGHNVLGILCGHLHTSYERIVENIPVWGLRSTVFQFAVQAEPMFCLEPPHYRLVTVHQNVMTSRVFEVPL
jgi:Icc protein